MRTTSNTKIPTVGVKAKSQSSTALLGHKKMKISYKYKEYQNSQYNKYMEDIGLTLPNFCGNSHKNLFAIFDGHGGDTSAKICVEQFPKIFETKLKMSKDVESSLKATFKELDEKTKESMCIQVGNTATIVYIEDTCLYCANVGDSKSVLLSRKAARKITYDDICTDEAEIKRVTSEGGQIIEQRLGGVLAISRSIGDHDLKSSGLSSVPHITKINLTSLDKYCVLASDGVWDVISEDMLVKLSQFAKDVSDFAEIIIKKAVDLGSMDNISCIVISFV